MGKYDDLSEGIIEGAQGHLAWSERAAAIVADIDTRLDAVTPPTSGGIGLDSPEFTGTPKAPTAAPGTATTQIATTAFVAAAVGAGSGGGGDLTGTGSPQGVVTASPGTYYTDTTGACGAWRWLKVSGTGTAGWIVVTGDTGRRMIVGGLNANWSSFEGKYSLRRIGDAVWMGLPGLAGNASAVNPAFIIPSGFRPGGAFGAQFTGYNDAGSGVQTVWDIDIRGGTYGVRAANSTFITVGTGWTNWSWETSDPWPSTLPGTPA
ncbi:MAG: hypothetical protein JSS74_10450 [Actinobacteria bacterium]|nr:hypothetical protein [Actinomycetota bacterium]